MAVDAEPNQGGKSGITASPAASARLCAAARRKRVLSAPAPTGPQWRTLGKTRPATRSRAMVAEEHGFRNICRTQGALKRRLTGMVHRNRHLGQENDSDSADDPDYTQLIVAFKIEYTTLLLLHV
jgi:hypothetical protein